MPRSTEEEPYTQLKLDPDAPALCELGVDELVLNVLQRECITPAVLAVRGRLRVDVGPHTHVCCRHVQPQLQ